MASQSKITQNTTKYIVGNAFIACVLAALIMSILMPLFMVIFAFVSGHNINLFYGTFWSGYFLMMLAVGFYSLILTTTWGL